MPRRNNKSTAKKPKGSKSGISINIKNIMRQVQNERPPQDFINLTGKKPMDGTNTGYMTRLQTPAMTYASRPLSQFPSLASISNIDRGFAPPLSQLTSNSRPVLGGGAPIVSPERDNLNDVLETYRPPEVAIGPNPVVPTPAARGYTPYSRSSFSPVSATAEAMTPRLASAPLYFSGQATPVQGELGSFIRGAFAPDALDLSERLVALQVPAMATAAATGRRFNAPSSQERGTQVRGQGRPPAREKIIMPSSAEERKAKFGP